jgi:hypothetical protein
MNQSIKKIIITAIFVAALVIGWYHLRMGMKAIFVFRNNEPLFSWIGIIAGPLSTLPATIVAFFKRKLGGYWLIAGGFISFVSILLLKPESDLVWLVGRVALMILLPMLGLGIAFILSEKYLNINNT